MLEQVFLGTLVIFVSISIQSVMLGAAFTVLKNTGKSGLFSKSLARISLFVSGTALWLMVLQGVSVLAWALAFSGLAVFPDWDTAVYFSAVAFTTLGFGDIVLPPDWRQLAGFCAAHGLLVFGLSSAALVEAFRQALETSPEVKSSHSPGA